jgi:hypothetical protein
VATAPRRHGTDAPPDAPPDLIADRLVRMAQG